MKKLFFWCVLSVIFLKNMAAQHQSPNGQITKSPELDTTFRVFGLPIIFYSPDTKLGFGAGGIATFYTRQSPQRSNVTFSFAYTLRRQISVWFPYQIYFGKGKFLTYGELGWYKYLYQFFGIGNEVDPDFLEKYTARFPRVRATFLRNFKQGNAAGFRLAFDDFKIIEYDSAGVLLKKNIVGWAGGRSSGAGFVFWKDTRDNRFYASRGVFLEASAYFENRATGSDFQFSRLAVEATKYFSLDKKMILAVQAAGSITFGEAPFFNLSQLGGPKKLRGFFDGQFRDDHLFLFQTELRRALFWRIGGVVFGGTGTVFGTENENLKWRTNFGAGVRFQFDRKQKINIRVDYGFGWPKNQGFYLTFGEAF